MTTQFVGKEAAALILGCSPHTLKDWKIRYWVEGQEYIRLNSRTIRYTVPLIIAWMTHRNDPAAYARAVEIYRSGLLSNQPRPVGRRPRSGGTAK